MFNPVQVQAESARVPGVKYVIPNIYRQKVGGIEGNLISDEILLPDKMVNIRR